jgi:hypothetical protein
VHQLCGVSWHMGHPSSPSGACMWVRVPVMPLGLNPPSTWMVACVLIVGHLVLSISVLDGVVSRKSFLQVQFHMITLPWVHTISYGYPLFIAFYCRLGRFAGHLAPCNSKYLSSTSSRLQMLCGSQVVSPRLHLTSNSI